MERCVTKSFLASHKKHTGKREGKFSKHFNQGSWQQWETFFISPLKLCTGHSVTQVHPLLGGWVGRSRKSRGYCLKWLQIEPQIIQWHNLLQMLEGHSSHLPAPKSYFSNDLEFTRDTPSFLHRETGFALRQGEVIDKRETKMMVVHWHSFQFQWRIYYYLFHPAHGAMLNLC